MDEKRSYPSNVIDGFAMGTLLDLRARIALDILRSPLGAALAKQEFSRPHGLSSDCTVNAAPIAAAICNVAQTLVGCFEDAGWARPIPEGDELNAALEKHARRLGRFQCQQQIGGNKEAQESQNRIAPVGASAVPPGGMPGH